MSESGKEKVTSEQIKELRGLTGAGVMDCKHALEDSAGDIEKAVLLLREKGLARAKQRQERKAEQGVIESYIHIGGQIGSLVELNCETDFVARSGDFLELAHQIALQVAACNPRYTDRDSVPAEVVEAKRGIYRMQCESEGRPAEDRDGVVEGMLEKYYQEICLLEQPFIKDPSVSIGELLGEASGRLGEKIAVRRFSRFQVDEEEEAT